MSPATQYAAACGTGLFVGFLTELLQLVGPRDADFSDLILNGVGVVLAVTWWCTFDERLDGTPIRRKGGRIVLRIVAIAGFVVSLYPLIPVWEAYRERDDRLPVLFSFDTASQGRFMASHLAVFERVAPPDGWGGEIPEQVLRLRFSRYEGGFLMLNEPYGDWRGHDALVIDLFHPGTRRIELGIGIDDQLRPRRYRDRFNARFPVEPGFNRLRFPIAEIAAAPPEHELNIADIKRMALYPVDPVGGYEIYLGPVRLEATSSTSPD